MYILYILNCFLLTEEGQLYTWGSNSEGQIGHRDEIDDDSCIIPRKVKLRGKVVSVACGYYHMAVVTGQLFKAVVKH